MTDAQFGALLSTLVGVGGALSLTIRWAVGRITKAWDDQTASNVRLANAQIESAARDAEMRSTMMQGMQQMQSGLSQILSWMFDNRRPSSTQTPVGLQSIDDESGEFTRPGADRRRRAQTPLQIPRPRPQHHDDNE